MDEPVALRTTIAGPRGPVYIAATDRGVVAIEWLTTVEAFDAAVARRLGGRVVPAGTVEWPGRAEQHLRDGAEWVESFLSGTDPKTAPADRPGGPARLGPVRPGCRGGDPVGHGPRATARSRAGSARRGRRGPWAARWAAIRSSFLIPCHRVIASDGTLGGWGGDRWGDLKHRLRNKQDLLLREGVTVAPRAD